MKLQFKKLDFKKLDEIPDGVDVLFVWENNRKITTSFVGTLKQAKGFKMWDLENTFTHYLVLPKIIHKK